MLTGSVPQHVYIVTVLDSADVEEYGSFDAPLLGYLLVDPTAHKLSLEAVLFARLGEWVLFPNPRTRGSDDLRGKYLPYARRPHVIAFPLS